MHYYLESVTPLQFSGVKHLKESVRFWIIVLLTHHIKTRNHVCHFISFHAQINLLLNLASPNNFQTADNDPDLEKRETLLYSLLNAFENFYLLFQRDRVVIIIENHTKNVSYLDDCDHLFQIILADFVQNLLKEWLIIVQIICEHELILETFPDFVVFDDILGRLELNLFYQIIVKLDRGFCILSQRVYFDITIKLTTFL